jgi:hypothetical protein
MKVRVDNTVDELTESNRQLDPAERIRVVTSDGTEFDVSEDQNTGALRVSTYRGAIVVAPRAANVVHLFEQSN